MKKLTIILIFGSICENKVNGENGLDLFELKPIYEKLDGDLLKDKMVLENTVACSGIEYLDCYKTLLKVYEENIEYEIANAINESILKKLTNYNALILLLFTKIDESAKRQYANESFTADLIKSIRFQNSNAYCVVDFLRRFDISPNDKLKHIIFHNDPKILNEINIGNATKLKTLILDYFKAYDEILMSDPIYVDDSLNPNGTVEQIVEIFQNPLHKSRLDINNFSTPFCSTQFPQMNENAWTWKKLQNSILLSENHKSSDSLMNWEDLKNSGTVTSPSKLLRKNLNYTLLDLWEITEKTFKKNNKEIRLLEDYLEKQIIRSEETKSMNTIKFEEPDNEQQRTVITMEEITIENTNKFKDLDNEHRIESLNKMFNRQYDDAKFNQVDTFYYSVIATIDAYVTKVLFCRVLHLVSGVLTSYFEVVSTYKIKHIQILIDTYFRQILNFGYEFEMFIMTLEMYINHQPLFLDKSTINDMYLILIEARARFLYHIVKMNDPNLSVVAIRKKLDDQRFHRDSNDLKFTDYTTVENCNESLDLLLDELQLININFVHIIEVKTIPNEA